MGNNNDYMRAYMARRYTDRRARALVILGEKCAKCVVTESLEVDHIDRHSKTRSSRWWANLSEARFLAEMEKCQLLCRRHHMLKTLEERGQVSARGRHGTLSAYRYCRCDACKAAKRASNRQQRLRRNHTADV